MSKLRTSIQNSRSPAALVCRTSGGRQLDWRWRLSFGQGGPYSGTTFCIKNAHEEQALDNYQQTVLTSFEDVENALTAYAREQVRHQSLARAAEAYQQALQVADQLYQKGLVDFLRVLDTQRSLYNSQDTLVQSQQTVILNLIQLYKALGGGWDS